MIVVTNNPLLVNEQNALPIEGGFRDVLLKVRDMVFSGYELVTHPLFASSRMMFSPFRTVVLGEKHEHISESDCRIAEAAILSFDRIIARRNLQPEHDGDYAVMDKRLYLSALDEVSHLVQAHVI